MSVSTRAGKRLLSRDDWIDAALAAMGADGVAAVAVDRLAKQLGATRGSFYWHFTDRRELLDAALERWELDNTTNLMPEADAIPDPVERLRVVFRAVYEEPGDPVEVALSAAADDPLVAPVLARVIKTRLAFLRRIFRDLDLPRADAADRAWLAYAFYVGHHQLATNEELRKGQPKRLDRLVELLCAPVARGDVGG